MSNANITLVQGLYAAFGRGDIAHIVAAMAPDATWEVVGRSQDYNLFGKRKGQQAVQDFFKGVGEQQQATDFSPREFHASGDLVFALGHYDWIIKKSGRKISADWIHVFTIKAGKVTSFREFTDTAQYVGA